nr:S9 family peptidase [candidate division Zixibacteria bacterium]
MASIGPIYAHISKRTLAAGLVAILILFGIESAPGMNPAEQTYQSPPQVIADIIDAPPTPLISVSPDSRWLLLMDRPGFPPIDEVARPELRLAGVRIDPQFNSPGRQTYFTGLSLKEWSDNEETKVIGLPENPRISNIKWSPDSRKLAFTVLGTNGVELWLIDNIDKPGARRLADILLNDAYGKTIEWTPDSKALICKILLPDRGTPPEKPAIPAGPVIQENLGQIAPAATYADLLTNPHDESLLEYYLTGQLVRIEIDSNRENIGPPGIISSYKISPDGQYLLVETIQRPFSYLVQINNFPHRIEIWRNTGDFVRLITDQPLAEEIPTVTGAVRTGPRQFEWRADADAILCWVEALDKGDPRLESEVRDQIYTLKAPFRGNPIPLFALNFRYDNILWQGDRLAIVSEWWWPTRRIRKWAFAPDDMRVEPEIILDYSWEDRYNHPGSPVEYINEQGQPLLLLDKDRRAIFLIGEGASSEGNRPFLDLFNLETHKTARLWQSEAPYYEEVVRILDVKDNIILTRRESLSEPHNYFIRELNKNKLIPITHFPHPYPQMNEVKKELIRYRRADSLDLTGTLYLPPGYTSEQGPLPTYIWAYPREFKSLDAAGQVTDSPYQFARIGWWSPIPWVMRGYAVLDRASMPIVGEGDEEPNDTFIEQLVDNARAAVKELVRRGVTDPDRVAIGGHSYGAFMAANLLAHSDIFRAGIARTGAYNRTLTPFGFQNEDRTLWEAPDIYYEMSPFMHVDSINEPILIIHGEADNNPGTFPMQSERFYNALKGHGAITRLVMLPHESHSYQARESIMHVLWETDRWLETYVKNASPRDTVLMKPE